jgi:hypothetical protein
MKELLIEFTLIEGMAYGSYEQHLMVDEWYKRFIKWIDDNPDFDTDDEWCYIHNTDVGYKTRQRFLITG